MFIIINMYIYVYIIYVCIYTCKLNFMCRNKWEKQMTMRTLYLNTTGQHQKPVVFKYRVFTVIYFSHLFLYICRNKWEKSRKKVFVKDSMSKRKKMSFLFILLPWLSNGILWSINKLKQGLCIYIYVYVYIYIYTPKSIYIVLYLISEWLLPGLKCMQCLLHNRLAYYLVPLFLLLFFFFGNLIYDHLVYIC